MVSRTSDWRGELGRWLKPFLDRLGHKARRQMCPLHVSGLIRSWRPQERSADGEAACARRMRSIASLHCGRCLGCNACGNRTTCPSRQARRRQRCRACDRRYCDTQERYAFGGVAPQYASATLGKTANCQTLVSLTRADAIAAGPMEHAARSHLNERDGPFSAPLIASYCGERLQ
jgi:hypothetical protein